MKKNRIRLSVFLLVLVLIISVFGCSNSKGGSKGSSQSSAKGGNKNLPDKLDNPDTSILSNMELDMIYDESFKTYEEKYGGKINYIQVAGPELQTKVVSLISAGDSPDIVHWTLAQMPSYMIKDIIQPIDDYFDINDPVWNKKAMDQFKFKGKYYGINKDVVAYIIFYNKTMFENNGVKTPLEYYKEGNWTFDTFREAAMKLTQDTDRDGLIDQYGFSLSQNFLFVYANGGELVKFNDDGMAVLNLTDSKVLDGFQFTQDGYTKYKYIDPVNAGWQDKFAAGKIAMVTERRNSIAKQLKEMKYEWDIAPFPIGPSGNKDEYPGGGGNFGIVTGAKNPQGAVAWMYIFTKIMNEKQYDWLGDLYNKEQLEILKHCESNSKFYLHLGIGKLNNLMNTNFWNPLKNNKPIPELIDTTTPILQEEINLIYKDI